MREKHSTCLSPATAVLDSSTAALCPDSFQTPYPWLATRYAHCAHAGCLQHGETSTTSCQAPAAGGRRPYFIGNVVGHFMHRSMMRR